MPLWVSMPVSPQQIHLQMVQEVHIGQAALDRLRQPRIVGQKLALATDRQNRIAGQPSLRLDLGGNFFRQRAVLRQFGMAPGDRQSGLGQSVGWAVMTGTNSASCR